MTRFAALSLGLTLAFAALSPSPALADQRAVEAANLALVKQVFAALEKGDLQTINRAFAPDGVSVFGLERRPRGGPHRTFAEAAPFPGALDRREVKIEQLFADGNWVAVRSTICGDHVRTMGALPAGGKRVCSAYINLYEIAGGRIVTNIVGTDRQQLRDQIEAKSVETKPAAKAASPPARPATATE